MDITNAEQLLKKHGVDDDTVGELKRLASALPESNMQIKMRGLGVTDSLVLTSRLLNKIATQLGIKFPHSDAIGIANFKVKNAPSFRSSNSPVESDEIMDAEFEDLDEDMRANS